MRSTQSLRRGVVLAISSACVLALASCGAVKDDTDSSAESDSTATTGSGGSQSLHDQLPADIREAGTIKVATGASYPPDQYVDADGTTIVGWSVDILRAVGERLEVDMAIENLDFPGILPAIQANKYDIGSSSYAVTDDRLEAVDFVTYFQNGQYVAVAQGNPTDVDATDVCGRTMAVTQGSLSEKTAATLSADCTAAGKPPLQVQAFANASAVYLAIASGRAEITVVNGSTLGNLPEDIEAIGDSFLPATVGFIFSKEDVELRDAFHAALQEMIEDGTYVDILEEWGIENGAVQSSEVMTEAK